MRAALFAVTQAELIEVLAAELAVADPPPAVRACESDPDSMFPEATDRGSVAYAKSVCGRCPLRVECLDGALDRREQYGVWGGELLTPHNLHRVRRKRSA